METSMSMFLTKADFVESAAKTDQEMAEMFSRNARICIETREYDEAIRWQNVASHWALSSRLWLGITERDYDYEPS